MKTPGILFSLLTFAFTGHLATAAVGYFDGVYVILNPNGGGNTYYQTVEGVTVSGNQTFNVANDPNLSTDSFNPELGSIGTFDVSLGQSLGLNGFEFKTFNDGGDSVDNATFFYRVSKTGTTPGSFQSLFTSTATNVSGNNKTWTLTSEGVDLLSGLDNGDYLFEYYIRGDASFTSGGGGTFSIGNWNDGDSPIVPTASFSVIPEPSIALLGSLGLLGLMRRKRH